MKFIGIEADGWVAIATFIVAIATFIAAIVASKNSRKIFEKSSEDEWLKTFQAHYFSFWNDADLRDVRMAIMNDEAYEEIKPILAKRLESPESLTKQEYQEIDKVDKFINTLTVIRQTDPNLGGKLKIGGGLFLKFWYISPKKMNRLELLEYIREFYPNSYQIILEREWSKKRT